MLLLRMYIPVFWYRPLTRAQPKAFPIFFDLLYKNLPYPTFLRPYSSRFIGDPLDFSEQCPERTIFRGERGVMRGPNED